ncbi:helix-turn-helix domain-containing protein [Sinorhizobium meliloti]|uniref:helix-turn-helix domain-containing protein n=1 Tax=Rhizobium meliloti TaxID=382 RepID=UPI00299ECFF0|nr:helix-turn-helix domain-containing protein [Sinorhizobium meliloti]MDX0033059.1 helix-turn-helix domain-containing protein [Sinorhizobium meliloti]
MHRPAPSVEERLAAEIASLRASGHSLAEIARECRISRQTLWRIEVGDCRRLSFDVGQKIENGIRKMRGE